MTIQTLTTTYDPYRNHPDYYLGRADAYDDSRTRTVDQMIVLMSMAIDHATLPYAHGYADRVNELRLELDAVAPMEMEIAHTNHAREHGRNTDSLHQERAA